MYVVTVINLKNLGVLSRFGACMVHNMKSVLKRMLQFKKGNSMYFF